MFYFPFKKERLKLHQEYYCLSWKWGMAYSTHSSNYKKPKHQKGEGSKITQLTIIKTERLAHSTWTILIIFPTCNPSIGPWSERSVTISFLQILIQASFVPIFREQINLWHMLASTAVRFIPLKSDDAYWLYDCPLRLSYTRLSEVTAQSLSPRGININK